jgi:ligand-binding sensor domain-containing protein
LDPEQEKDRAPEAASDVVCDACGASNPEDVEKCRNCGEDLYEDDEEGSTRETTAEQEGGGLGEWRGLIVVGAIFCVVIAVWLLWSPPKPTATSAAPGEETKVAETEKAAASKAENEVKEIEIAGPDVWVGTSRGAYLYDRKTGAEKLHLEASGGLPHDFIDAILVDRNGKTWFGGYGGGISLYDDGKWTHYDASKTGGRTVVAAMQDRAGTYWFATGGAGLYRFDGQKWTAYTTANGLPHDEVNTVAQDRDGSFWIGTNAGVAHLKDGTFKTYGTADGLANEKVLVCLVDRDGGKWFGTWGGGISRFDGTKWTQVPSGPNGPRSPFVLSGKVDAQGGLWFGTHEGVSYFDGKAWTHFTSENGLLGTDVYALDIDPDGYLWFGTYKGVSSLSPDHKDWKTYAH